MPTSGGSCVALHYLGELVLTAVAFGYAIWRAFGTSQPLHRRVDWLKRSPVWFRVGLACVVINLVLQLLERLVNRAHELRVAKNLDTIVRYVLMKQSQRVAGTAALADYQCPDSCNSQRTTTTIC